MRRYALRDDQWERIIPGLSRRQIGAVVESYQGLRKGTKMADDVAETARKESKPLTELEKFFIKVATVFVAAFIFLWMATSYVNWIIDDISFLKGGPQFWHDVENKLREFADAPDMPPAKKAAIVKQLEKVARKYRPFVDALSASEGKGPSAGP